MQKDLAKNMGLACISVLFCFIGLEFVLRVTGIQTVKPNPPKIYQTSNNPAISFELIPNIERKAYRNTVTTNSLGFRSPELDPNKPMIAILGDSITFGYGVADDETLPAQINALMPEYNVLNAASPAYQLLQETATYKEKIMPLKPEHLILIFYFNDFTDSTAWLDDIGVVRAPDWVPGKDICAPIDRGLLQYLPGKCWLDTNSAMYKIMKKIVNMRHGNEQLAEQREESKAQPKADTVTRGNLRLYSNQLDDLVALLPVNMPRTFVIWPDRFLHEVSRPKLIKIATERGFKVIDLYDTFGNEVPTLGWDTVHPSKEAIEEAAKIIANEVKQ
ncbi:MAG: hypothetical protein O2904_03990 [bacterium]|nr:hypothetical protein [bacterium]